MSVRLSFLQKSLLAVFAVLLMLFSAPAFAVVTDRYVATGGSDTGDCSDSNSPCLTIQYAIGQSVAGDTVNVAAGTYAGNLVIPVDDLSLIGAGVGNSIINLAPGYGIAITAHSGFVMDGFTVNGSTSTTNGTYAVKASVADNITISNCNFIGQSGGGGVDFITSNNAVLNNVVASGFQKNGFSFTTRYTADQTGANNITFNNITADNNGWAGIALYTVGNDKSTSQTSTSIGGASSITGVQFIGTNIISNNPKGIQVQGDSDANALAGTTPSYTVTTDGTTLNLVATAFTNNLIDILNYQTAPVYAIDATFEGKTGNAMTPAERTAQDLEIYDKLDLSALGLVTYYTPACSDTVDNDSDTFIDNQDPGCYDNGNVATGVYDANDNDESHTPACGNGAIDQQSEQCDDGNNVDGDGCSAQCQIESDPGSLKITKYLCPFGTTPNRVDNGVGKTVPEGCEVYEGAHFGYYYNPDNSGVGLPYTDFNNDVQVEATTDDMGMITWSDLPVVGRYLVFETDGNGEKVDFETDDLLALYCETDPDTTKNDNGDIALLTEGETTECIAYNEAPEPTMATLTLVKVVNGEGAPDEEDEWTLTAGDPLNGGFEGTTGVSQSVDPGTYPLTETAGGDVEGSYTPSEWECEGTGYSDDPDDYDSENNTITLEAGDNITCTITNTYVPAPTTATVKICKEDLDGNRLDGWELFLTGEVDSFPVPANDPAGVDSDAVLASGVNYIVKASGTWKNGNVRYADAEYTSVDNSFAPPEDGAGGQGERNELQIDERFDADGNNWGPFDPTHTYEQTIVGNGATISLRVFEGTGTQQDSDWYDRQRRIS
jgi:cysteine-rich repeat protein